MKAILYNNGGSGNHGCEAIVRMLASTLQEVGIDNRILMTLNKKEEQYYGLHEIINIENAKTAYSKRKIDFFCAYIMNKIFGKYIYLDILPYKSSVKKFDHDDIAFAIGGDTYCYGYSDTNTYMHKLYCKQGIKTVLWACSIEPDALKDRKVLEDIKSFDYITARESITFNVLQQHNVKNISLIPDLAFALPKYSCNESSRIVPNKTIGLNISPLIMNYQNDGDIILENCQKLIEYILEEFDYTIALIPHVVWEQSDDRQVLNKLYEMYKYTDRVILIEDHNCMELKDIISKCRFFIGARTHATIAAYSSCVPTLALGYSVKSRGIAKDLFGTDEDYVIPVQNLKDGNDLKRSFQWLLKNEEKIKNHLIKIMPSYIDRVNEATNVVSKII